ncbi:UNVERIFIED_CONTAM: hypothetical protein FKN15_003815 [Acipenser sinensis]
MRSSASNRQKINDRRQNRPPAAPGREDSGSPRPPPRPRRGAWESSDCAQLPADKLDLLEKFFAPVENQNQNRRNNQRTYRSDRVRSELDLRGDLQRRGWIGEGEKGGPCYPRRGGAQASSSTSSSSSSSSSASWSSEESTQSFQLPPSNKNRNVIGAPRLYQPARQSRSCVDIPGEMRAGYGRGGEEEEEEEEGGDAGSGRQRRGRSGERQGFPRIRRGQSKSEERLLGSESEPGRRLFKTVSLERSLAFNDQVLPAPWTPKKPGSSAQLPSKGILKNGGHKPGTEGVFRKAKSMEVIWDREGSRAQGVRSAGKTGCGEQEEEEEEEEEKERGTVPVFVQEKLKFSAFLNEITRQVLSPSRLSSLGLKPETPSRNQHSRSREKRREEEEDEEEGGEPLGGGPEEEDGGVEGESQGAPRRDSEPRRRKKRSSGSLSPARCSSRRSARQGQGNSASPQGPGAVRQNQPGPSRHTDASSSSPETSPGPARHGRRGPAGASRLTDASTSPELGPLLPGRGDSGSAAPASPSRRLQQRSQQHSLHPRDQRVRDEGEDSHRSQSQSLPQHSVPAAQGSRSGTSAERCGRREREEEEAGVRTSAPPYKDQNPGKTGQVGSEFKSSPHHLEAELQRTREELRSLSDRYRRLREDYSSSQQTNQALEERLRSAIPSLLQEVLGKHFLELEDHTDQSLLPPAPFVDSAHSEMELRPAGPSNQSQGRMGPVPEEDESDWLEKGGEELVPHFEFCTPHQSLPVPSLDTKAPCHGKLTRDSPAGDQGYRNKPHPQAHRGCSGSLSSPLRLLSTSLEEILPTAHRPTDCHLQPTEGLQDLHQPLGESPEDSDDSESSRPQLHSPMKAAE